MSSVQASRGIFPPIKQQKKLHKEFIREKLAIALEKQKAGKKMHINEFKLILDDLKK